MIAQEIVGQLANMEDEFYSYFLSKTSDSIMVNLK